MKKSTVIILIVAIMASCACTVQQGAVTLTSKPETMVPPTNTPLPEGTITPAFISTFTPCPRGDSGHDYYYPATATPTWLEYQNSKGEQILSIKRDIYYSNNRSYCNYLPSSDYVITIKNNNKEYLLSGIDIKNEANSAKIGMDDDPPEFINVGPILDIDSDGFDEIVLYLMDRGGTCCTTTVVIYYDIATDEYHSTNGIMRKFTRFAVAEIVDKDNIPEFRTINTDFTFAMGAADAMVGISPIQIYSYRNKSLIESTKEFPQAIEKDANSWLDYFYSEKVLSDYSIQCLALSAYVADMYNLNRSVEAWQVFDTRCSALSDHVICVAYKEKLSGFLVKYGYSQ
jgi:hypothetical protein